MRCILCGAAETSVSSQHTDAEGLGIRRTRMCARGHKFPTAEVPLNHIADQRERRAAQRSIAARIARWERDVAIASDPRPATRVAEELGLTPMRIRQIRASHAKFLPKPGR